MCESEVCPNGKVGYGCCELSDACGTCLCPALAHYGWRDDGVPANWQDYGIVWEPQCDKDE